MLGPYPTLVLIGVAILGLLIGSFVNVLIYRVPRGESINHPGSHCPHCGHPIRPWHNVPVVGWLLLRGRCADCRAPIGVRYPLIEAGVGALFVVLTLRLAQLHLLAATPAYLCFAAIGAALALIDLEHRRLPDALVLPLFATCAVLLLGATAYYGQWWALARAVIGAAALFAFYLALALITGGGMGLGDVKLAAVVGLLLAYLSWSTLLVGAFGAFVIGALVGAVVLIRRGGGRGVEIVFGPFMVAAALLAVFIANPVAHEYLRLVRRD